MSDHRPAVSARGVLDGDPTALASLCDLRGPAVVAYCDAVCGPAAAIEAAAAAFASFRATAAGATRPLAINPDALLLAKARESAAAHAPDPSGGSPRPDDPLCPEVPRLLAGAAEGALTPGDRHHLRRHLARCVPCRAAQNAQRAAERAYAHPPSPTLPPMTRQAVIAALRHAIPPAAPSPAPPPPAPAARAGAPTGLAPTPAGRTPSVASDAARPRLLPSHAPPFPAVGPAEAPGLPPPAPQSGPARVPPTAPTPPPAPRPAMPAPGSHVSGSPGPGAEAATGVIPVDQVAAALGYADHPAGPAPPPDPAPSPRGLALARLAGTGIARLPRARVLAPVAVLVAALLVILAIAGVFSSGSHAPAPAPASSAAPPAVRPAALDHSPAAHRARLRAAARRRAARARAARARKRAAAAPATGATTAATGSAAPAGGSSAARAPAASPPASGAPTTRVLAAPAAIAPPVNGAAPATSGGFRGD